MRPSVCFVVEKIIGVSSGDGNMKNYQVQWAPTWVSSSNLVGCQHLIEEFHEGNKQCEENSENNTVFLEGRTTENFLNKSPEHNQHNTTHTESLMFRKNRDTENVVVVNSGDAVKLEFDHSEQCDPPIHNYEPCSDEDNFDIHHLEEMNQTPVVFPADEDGDLLSDYDTLDSSKKVLSPKQTMIRENMRHDNTATLFTCVECGRQFTNKQNYTRHQRMHTDYPCNHCGKLFAQFKNLERHMETHAIKVDMPESENIPTETSSNQAICDDEYMMAMLKLPGPFIEFRTMKRMASRKLRQLSFPQFEKCFRQLASMNVGLVHEPTKRRGPNSNPLLLQKGDYEDFHDRAKQLICKSMYDLKKNADVDLNPARLNLLLNLNKTQESTTQKTNIENIIQEDPKFPYYSDLSSKSATMVRLNEEK